MGRLFDKAKIPTRKKTAQGYLIADAVLSRTGVQNYTPHELINGGIAVPAHLLGNTLIRLNRPAEEVFNPTALKGLENLPLTIAHPSEDVTPDNIKELQAGISLSPAVQSGDFATAPIMAQSREALDLIDAGVDQLSVGYDSDIIFFEPAELPGKSFDGYMTNIRPNHIALVDTARGGQYVRIQDKGDTTMDKESRILDGVSFDFTPQSAQAVDKLVKRITDMEKATATEIKDFKSKLSDAEGKRDAAEAEIKKHKDTQLSDEAIAQKVLDRSNLIEEARGYLGDGVADLAKASDLDIQKAIIKSVHDGLDLTDKDAGYVVAVLDSIREYHKEGAPASASKQLQDAMNKEKQAGKLVDSEKARKEMIAAKDAAFRK